MSQAVTRWCCSTTAVEGNPIDSPRRGYAGGIASWASAINDVVGYFNLGLYYPYRAFIYTANEGMVDLNTRIDRDSGWQLDAAQGLNDAGEIVGSGRFMDDPISRGFKLTPYVADTTPPAISSVSAKPAVLWPPNGQMMGVELSVIVSDNMDPAPRCRITEVRSSDADRQNGNADWQLTGDLTVDLRARRSGSGDGRTYLVSVKCWDAAGNASVVATPVEVPHDSR